MITLAQFQVTRSGLPVRYDHIHLDRIVPIESTMLSQSDAINKIGVPNWGRSDTRIYVLMLSVRTDALCCDIMRLWSRATINV